MLKESVAAIRREYCTREIERFTEVKREVCECEIAQVTKSKRAECEEEISQLNEARTETEMFLLAVRFSHVVLVKALIEAGANVNAADEAGNLPIFAAIEKGRKNIVELLVTSGADVNARDIFDDTPLLAATGRGRFDIARILIAAGADINVRDYGGVSFIEYLLQHAEQKKEIL